MKKNKKLIVIAGPCVIESRSLTLEIAKSLKEISDVYPIDLIFKASFDKANRTSLSSFRGPGLVKGIKILEEVKKRFKLKILSDVHSPDQIAKVKKVLDISMFISFNIQNSSTGYASNRNKV